MQTLAALAAEPVAALVDTMWVGRIGPLELAACAAAAAIFSLVAKLINVPLAAVTTSLVAAATAAPAAGKAGRCTWRGGGGRCGWLERRPGGGAAAPDRKAAVSGALCAALAAGVLQGAPDSKSAPRLSPIYRCRAWSPNSSQRPACRFSPRSCGQ